MEAIPGRYLAEEEFAEAGRDDTSIGQEWSLSLAKRIFDFTLAVLVLAFFALPMAIIYICIRLTSRGPAIYVQERVGQGGNIFRIYKFRSMVVASADEAGPTLTKDGDERITGIGRVLRKFKLDELPQFVNILRGDMSLVGPRPKLPQYAEPQSFRYRPGVTGAATLAFRCEEMILRRVPVEQLDDFYQFRIKPLKERLDVRYMRKATLWSDLRLLATTFLACFVRVRVPATLRNIEEPAPIHHAGTTEIHTGFVWEDEAVGGYPQGEPELVAAD
ncbi:MAG TPA: sugar transferase [Terracidiphilus sp.]|nr:sugar transferase [Terracidiphilus sp.]